MAVFKRAICIFEMILMAVGLVMEMAVYAETINFITQTRPCNILQYFKAVKILIFRSTNIIFFLFFLKT